MSIHQILKGANTFERKNRAYQATFRHFFWRYAADGGSTDRYHEGLQYHARKRRNEERPAPPDQVLSGREEDRRAVRADAEELQSEP